MSMEMQQRPAVDISSDLPSQRGKEDTGLVTTVDVVPAESSVCVFEDKLHSCCIFYQSNLSIGLLGSYEGILEKILSP